MSSKGTFSLPPVQGTGVVRPEALPEVSAKKTLRRKGSVTTEGPKLPEVPAPRDGFSRATFRRSGSTIKDQGGGIKLPPIDAQPRAIKVVLPHESVTDEGLGASEPSSPLSPSSSYTESSGVGSPRLLTTLAEESSSSDPVFMRPKPPAGDKQPTLRRRPHAPHPLPSIPDSSAAARTPGNLLPHPPYGSDAMELRKQVGRGQGCDKGDGNILAAYKVPQMEIGATIKVSVLLPGATKSMTLYATREEFNQLEHTDGKGNYRTTEAGRQFRKEGDYRIKGNKSDLVKEPTWGELTKRHKEEKQRFGLEIQFNNVGARLSSLERVADCVVNGHLPAYESKLKVKIGDKEYPAFAFTLDAVGDEVVLELVTPPVPGDQLDSFLKIIGPEVVRALQHIQHGTENPAMQRTGSLQDDTYKELELKYSNPKGGKLESRFGLATFNTACPLAQMTTSQIMTNAEVVAATQYQQKNYNHKVPDMVLVKAAAEYVDPKASRPEEDTVMSKEVAAMLTTRANKLGLILETPDGKPAYLVEYREGTDPPKIVAARLWEYMQEESRGEPTPAPDYSKPVELRANPSGSLAKQLQKQMPWQGQKGIPNILKPRSLDA